MYEAYIFDFYGTLVDISTNENKPYLWKKMSEIYTSLGAAYTPGELKAAFRRLEKQEIRKMQQTQERMREIQGHRKMDGQEDAGENSIQQTELDIRGFCSGVEPELRNVFKKLFLEKGAACDDDQAKMAGIVFRTLSRQKLQVYKGVKETLKELRQRGKSVYLLSNAQTDFTRPEIEMMGLTSYFDDILISSEEGVKKPSAAFFRILLDRYQLDPKKCLMVGNDETSDIAGALSVGLNTLYLHTETSPVWTGRYQADRRVMDGDWGKAAAILLES